jgi:hypothetical protein
MPQALDTVTFQATAPGAGAAAAVVTGDSANVRSVPTGKRALLINAWAKNQVLGTWQLTSPRLHDATRGLRFRVPAGGPQPLIAAPFAQQLYDQDTLSANVVGSAVGGAFEQFSLLVYYEDLQGVAGRFITKDDLMKRGVECVTVEDTITATAAGGYTGSRALNAGSDLLKGNQDYALIGYRVGIACTSICFRGADTGNLRVSGPGDALGGDYTRDWFLRLSDDWGIPLIPVFNSANKAGIQVDVVQDQAGAAVTYSAVFARLA